MPTETTHDNPVEQAQPEARLGPPQEAPGTNRASIRGGEARTKLEATRAGKMAIGICLLGCTATVGLLITWKRHEPHRAARPASEVANWQPGPGVVATEQELAKPWSAKPFTYRDPILDRDVPAMVVRLPDDSYWGFSLVDPIGGCQLEYVTDLDRLQSVYHFRADHPMVGNPCNLAVFDLLQYGGLPGAEVRGAPVHGMGVRPPIGIEIERDGEKISATKIE